MEGISLDRIKLESLIQKTPRRLRLGPLSLIMIQKYHLIKLRLNLITTLMALIRDRQVKYSIEQVPTIAFSLFNIIQSNYKSHIHSPLYPSK